MAPPSTAVAEQFDYDAVHHAISCLREKQVFFIGGAPKSGTTWLQLLLNAHPGISCSGEGHYVDRLVPLLNKAVRTHNASIEYKNQSIFEELDGQPLFTNSHLFYLAASSISLMLSHPAKAATASAVGDKTPDNVRFFPLISVLFPKAKFIHIVRDGRDCTVSAWFHNLRVDAVSLTRQYPSLGDFADYFAQIWINNVSQGVRFAAACPGRCLSLRYEDLTQHPMVMLGHVCKFLGVSMEPAVLQSCCAAADFTRFSGGRPRGTEDRGSFFRRGMPGDWRQHFDAKTEQAFRKKVEPWLSGFRYVQTASR
jgi:hypothetical protein